MQRRKGFTVVELLIVIVVIAILAAISIVAYNGIQTRAENTKTLQALTQYAKAVQMYAASKGQYPTTTVYPCLGPSGTQCAFVAGSGTCTGNGDGLAVYQPAFNTLLSEVITGPFPSLSSQQMNCSGRIYSGGYYSPSTGTTAQFTYYLKGDQPCNNFGGSTNVGRQQQAEYTRCVNNFPTL